MKEKEEEEEEDDDASSPLKSEIAKLRRRWELASVLNFFNVFEPVIGNDSLLSAEEIETGLVKPNESLAKLHIMLLKGIPPVSKLLNRSDGWVTVLCKKLALWWPWVAEGEIPLIASRGGDEISKYKDELDPVHRLLLLRALCEVRADQVDALSFINSEMKKGGAHRVSSFRKDKIGGDGSTSYWCDGNAVLGHRLYREVTVDKRNSTKAKAKAKGKACKATSSTSQWETLATNLQEFHQAVEELSSSRRKAEASVCQTIEADVLPEMEKLQKKKDRALKRKQTQEKLLNDVRAYTTTGLTRSCRNRRLISYTFDEYDRAIDEAIKQQPKKRKMVKEQKTMTMERVEQATSPNSGTEDSGADTESKGTDDHDDQGNSSSDDDGSGSSGQKEVGDDEEEDDDDGDDADEEDDDDDDDDDGGDDNEADSETQKSDENGNGEHSEKSSEADNENESVDDDTSGGDYDQNQVDSSSKSKSVVETQDTGDKE
ncbi:unnamed protein product [Linum trigynum]|uniref:DDT domain-containing protein DDR4 n=1 Tax=Linum trigynum TaxID=586398 RepID=A0AAV2EKD8_9ROSI